jgi:hypothetical protein
MYVYIYIYIYKYIEEEEVTGADALSVDGEGHSASWRARAMGHSELLPLLDSFAASQLARLGGRRDRGGSRRQSAAAGSGEL